jgi:hypothetical protein
MAKIAPPPKLIAEFPVKTDRETAALPAAPPGAVLRALAVLNAVTSAGVLHATMIVCASATGAMAGTAAPARATAIRAAEIAGLRLIRFPKYKKRFTSAYSRTSSPLRRQ